MQHELTEQEKQSLVLGIHNDGDELDLWDDAVAKKLANEEHIELTNDHLEVLGYLRRTYRKHGRIQHARSLTQALDTQFASKGGIKYLYTLFPNGPVTQGCKLAGIPAPSDSTNNSFGNTL